MSVEPGIVDTNVLVYALDADAPQHTAARALLDAARDDASVTLFVTSQILCEFYSIVTNPRRVPNPRTASEGVAAMSSLLAFLHVLPASAQALDGLLDLLRRHPVTGGDVFDLQIAATMQANGVQRIYTFNTADSGPFRNSRLSRLEFELRHRAVLGDDPLPAIVQFATRFYPESRTSGALALAVDDLWNEYSRRLERPAREPPRYLG